MSILAHIQYLCIASSVKSNGQGATGGSSVKTETAMEKRRMIVHNKKRDGKV